MFVKKPVDITVKAGQSAKLQCSATGQPQPVISWKKDGGDDFPAARERRMHVIPNDDQFFIVSTSNIDELKQRQRTCIVELAARIQYLK